MGSGCAARETAGTESIPENCAGAEVRLVRQV